MLLHDEYAAEALLVCVVEEELVGAVLDARAPAQKVRAVDGEHLGLFALVPLARPAGWQMTRRRGSSDVKRCHE